MIHIASLVLTTKETIKENKVNPALETYVYLCLYALSN